VHKFAMQNICTDFQVYGVAYVLGLGPVFNEQVLALALPVKALVLIVKVLALASVLKVRVLALHLTSVSLTP